MLTVNVDGLDFTFGKGWIALKYDGWSFYRNQFSRMRPEIKAVDLLVLSPAREAYFIEVKDYRRPRSTKPSALALEFSQKVFDTLAALLPAKLNANDAIEQTHAGAILGSRSIHAILHIEQPRKISKLFPRAVDTVDLLQRLKRLLKPIDAHPKVVEAKAMGILPWTVS